MKSLLTGAALIFAVAGTALAQDADPHAGHDMSAMQPAASASDATAAYEKAMEKMHGPMMKGVENPDPDAAFVLGMIPHHQGAIDMAEIVLKYGKDDFTRSLAEQVIMAQEKEITEMKAWLEKHGIAYPEQE